MPVHKRDRNRSGRKEYFDNGSAFCGQLGSEDYHGKLLDHINTSNGNSHSVVACCSPQGCSEESGIETDNPINAIKVICNNENCTAGEWMHKSCFEAWENHILNYLRTCGRARGWNEKQRLQNLWTKKGYDLAYKACDCNCGRGHIRKDLDYVPLVRGSVPVRQKRQRRNSERPVVVMQRQAPQHALATSAPQSSLQVRVRRNSGGESTASSTSSLSSSPTTAPASPSGRSRRGSAKYDFFSDRDQAAAGNIFHRRTNLDVFLSLPRDRQNPYHIKMEDDGLHGNDETRSFVLTQLSAAGATSLHCALCSRRLPVYDRYPLLDGTFFLSVEQHSRRAARVVKNMCTEHHVSGAEFLNAVCMWCMEDPSAARCRVCGSPWVGRSLLVGSMYAFDIFAAMPCCQARLTCKRCQGPMVDARVGLPFFSSYSRRMECPRCKANDFHFVRPLHELYHVERRHSHTH